MFKWREGQQEAIHHTKIKRAITSSFARALKVLQQKHLQCKEEEFVYSNDGSNNLCSSLESAFLHGLKDSVAHKLTAYVGLTAAPDQTTSMNFWSVVLKFTHGDVVTQLQRLTQITTEIGLCRAWVRLALNDGLMESYLHSMIVDTKTLKYFYHSHSYMRDHEQPGILKNYLTGLMSLEFKLSFNSSVLNQWSNTTLHLTGALDPHTTPAPTIVQAGTGSTGADGRLQNPQGSNTKVDEASAATTNVQIGSDGGVEDLQKASVNKSDHAACLPVLEGSSSSRVPCPGPAVGSPSSRVPCPGPAVGSPSSRLSCPGPAVGSPSSRLPCPGPAVGSPSSRVPCPGPAVGASSEDKVAQKETEPDIDSRGETVRSLALPGFPREQDSLASTESLDLGRTESCLLSGDQAKATGQSNAVLLEATLLDPAASPSRPRSKRVGEDDDSRPRSRRVGEDDDSRPRSRRVGEDDDSRPRSKRVGEDDDSRPRSKRVGEDDDSRPRSKRVGEDDDSYPRSRRVGEDVLKHVSSRSLSPPSISSGKASPHYSEDTSHKPPTLPHSAHTPPTLPHSTHTPPTLPHSAHTPPTLPHSAHTPPTLPHSTHTPPTLPHSAHTPPTLPHSAHTPPTLPHSAHTPPTLPHSAHTPPTVNTFLHSAVSWTLDPAKERSGELSRSAEDNLVFQSIYHGAEKSESLESQDKSLTSLHDKTSSHKCDQKELMRKTFSNQSDEADQHRQERCSQEAHPPSDASDLLTQFADRSPEQSLDPPQEQSLRVEPRSSPQEQSLRAEPRSSPQEQSLRAEPRSSPQEQSLRAEPRSSPQEQSLRVEPRSSPQEQSLRAEPRSSPQEQSLRAEPRSSPQEQSLRVEPRSSPQEQSLRAEPRSSPQEQSLRAEPRSSPQEQSLRAEPRSSPQEQSLRVEPRSSPQEQSLRVEPRSSPQEQSLRAEPRSSPQHGSESSLRSLLVPSTKDREHHPADEGGSSSLTRDGHDRHDIDELVHIGEKKRPTSHHHKKREQDPQTAGQEVASSRAKHSSKPTRQDSDLEEATEAEVEMSISPSRFGNSLSSMSGWSSEIESKRDRRRQSAAERSRGESFATMLRGYTPASSQQAHSVTLNDVIDALPCESDDGGSLEGSELSDDVSDTQEVQLEDTGADNFEVLKSPSEFFCGLVEANSSRMYFLYHVPREHGLSHQNFACKGCTRPIGIIYGPPRLCEFDGGLYCFGCHENNETYIPSSILYDWDFRKKKVSQDNYKFLQELEEQALYNVEELNPKLYNHVPELQDLKTLRQQLVYLKSYLFACSQKVAESMRQKVWPREHLYDSRDLFSVMDFLQVQSGSLQRLLKDLVRFSSQHVYDCNLCSLKGFVCEICRNAQVIYPFEVDTTIRCTTCKAVYHKTCMTESLPCPKCARWGRHASSSNINDCHPEDYGMSPHA